MWDGCTVTEAAVLTDHVAAADWFRKVSLTRSNVPHVTITTSTQSTDCGSNEDFQQGARPQNGTPARRLLIDI